RVLPRGGMMREPREIMATTTPSGSASSRIARPAPRDSGWMMYSTMSASTSRSELISSATGGSGRGGSSSPSTRASGGSVQPWLIAETSTTKNTASNSSSPLGWPQISGYVASTMGTAPLRPTQEMNASSRTLKRNGSSSVVTATGRATKIRATAISRPGPATATSRLGNASSPSRTNLTNWANQAAP